MVLSCTSESLPEAQREYVCNQVKWHCNVPFCLHQDLQNATTLAELWLFNKQVLDYRAISGHAPYTATKCGTAGVCNRHVLMLEDSRLQAACTEDLRAL